MGVIEDRLAGLRIVQYLIIGASIEWLQQLCGANVHDAFVAVTKLQHVIIKDNTVIHQANQFMAKPRKYCLNQYAGFNNAKSNTIDLGM